MGVQLPSGSQLKGGTLSAELAISGPLDKLVVSGPVRLANTQLANFDLGAKLGALSAFAGKSASSPNTSIQNVSLNARVSPEGTKADDINLNLPAIGVITGAGTVSPEGALAFKMIADLHGGVVGGLSKVAGARRGEVAFHSPSKERPRTRNLFWTLGERSQAQQRTKFAMLQRDRSREPAT